MTTQKQRDYNTYESDEKDRVTFDQLPEQIRKHYAEHFAEYGGCSIPPPANLAHPECPTCSNYRRNLAHGVPSGCSTWVFWHIWLWEDKAFLQFSLVPGELWVDGWKKSSDGNWVSTQSASIEE
jgi:hypothetical protein